MKHIIEVITAPATGVVVESVKFSHDIKRVVVYTAKNLLSELSHQTPGCNTKEALGTMYLNIKSVFEYWNSSSIIQVHMIRNAIRVLNLRINHCENSLKEGEWTELRDDHCPFVLNIIEKKNYKNYRKVGNEVLHTQYSGTTMAIMVATRQILVDSLIAITTEFE
jgi:hypothetical protein